MTIIIGIVGAIAGLIAWHLITLPWRRRRVLRYLLAHDERFKGLDLACPGRYLGMNYVDLAGMEDAGLITSIRHDDGARSYRITDMGRGYLRGRGNTR